MPAVTLTIDRPTLVGTPADVINVLTKLTKLGGGRGAAIVTITAPNIVLTKVDPALAHQALATTPRKDAT